MKYRATNGQCACGKRRRKGQRTCSDCHRASMKQYRAEAKAEGPEAILERAMTRVARPKKHAGMPAEMQKQLRSLAAETAAKIRAFNHAPAMEDEAA